jgi:hypothetical protein
LVSMLLSPPADAPGLRCAVICPVMRSLDVSGQEPLPGFFRMEVRPAMAKMLRRRIPR